MMALDNNTESWVTAKGVGGTGLQWAEPLQSQGLQLIPGLSTTPVPMGRKKTAHGQLLKRNAALRLHHRA